MDTGGALRQGSRLRGASAWGRPVTSDGWRMPAAPPRRAARAVSLEAAMEGPLPTVGGAWFWQYARLLAHSAQRPVGVLELTDNGAAAHVVGLTTFDCTGSGVRSVPHAASRAHVSRPGGFSDFIRMAVRDHAPAVRHWLVRVFDPLDALGRSVLSEVDGWTLVAGAPSAFFPQTVPQVRAMARRLQRTDRADATTLGIGWMGAPPAACLLAHHRLTRHLSANHAAPLVFRGCQPRIAPVRIVSLARCASAPAAWWCARPWLRGGAKMLNETRDEAALGVGET